MNDTDAAVRYWAAVGCCIRKADAAPALEPLRKLAKDSSPAVRAAAAEALCVLGHVDEGLPLLIEACKSGDGVLATNALDALGEAAKPAGQALADNSLKLNEYAARKMEWLLEKWGVSRPDNKKRGKVE
jgi:HEAT repeat protein